jgi:hypothetical protein
LRRNCFLERVIERKKGGKDEEENVSGYWRKLREEKILE